MKIGLFNGFKGMYNSIAHADKVFEGLKNGFSKIGDFLWNNVGTHINKAWEDFTGLTANKENLEFQRENLDYEKALQEKIFEREDNAYQRTSADMRAAGLSPLSMSGVNGAGDVVETDPLNRSRTSDIQALGQIINVINQVSATRSNTTLSNAQANLVNAQADNQRIKNLWEDDILSKTFEGLDLDTVGKRFNNERSNISWNNEKRNLAFNEQFGLSDNMPDFVKMLNYATHQGKLSNNWNKNYSPENWKQFGHYFTNNENFANPEFSNLQSLLEKSNLKGALQDNAVTNALLRLIGIY